MLPPCRVEIQNEPFSTFTMFDRKKIPASESYFLYPIHMSSSFLICKGLNSALYLMLLRFIRREYADVFRLCDSVATDTNFTDEGLVIYNSFAYAADDWHPDAHACRMKISLLTRESGAAPSWDLALECAWLASKLDCVSSECRLAPEEEFQIMDFDEVVTAIGSDTYDAEKYSNYLASQFYNRKKRLLAEISASRGSESSLQKLIVECKCPTRNLLSNWQYYQDNTIFGENYAKMVEVLNTTQENNWVTCVSYLFCH